MRLLIRHRIGQQRPAVNYDEAFLFGSRKKSTVGMDDWVPVHFHWDFLAWQLLSRFEVLTFRKINVPLNSSYSRWIIKIYWLDRVTHSEYWRTHLFRISPRFPRFFIQISYYKELFLVRYSGLDRMFLKDVFLELNMDLSALMLMVGLVMCI